MKSQFLILGWFVTVLMWYSYCVEINVKENRRFLLAVPQCDKTFTRGSCWSLSVSEGWRESLVRLGSPHRPVSRGHLAVPPHLFASHWERVLRYRAAHSGSVYRPPSYDSPLGQLFVSTVVAPVYELTVSFSRFCAIFQCKFSKEFFVRNISPFCRTTDSPGFVFWW